MQRVLGVMAVFAAVLFLATASNAETRFFFCAAGVDGEATLIGKEGCINALAVKQEIMRLSEGSKKDGGAEVGDVRIVKQVDKASAELIARSTAANSPISEGSIFVTKVDESVLDHVELFMCDIFVEQVELNLDGQSPLETVTVSAGRLEWIVNQFDGTGELINTERFCYDTTIGSQCNSPLVC